MVFSDVYFDVMIAKVDNGGHIRLKIGFLKKFQELVEDGEIFFWKMRVQNWIRAKMGMRSIWHIIFRNEKKNS